MAGANNYPQNELFDGNIMARTDGGDMGKQERREVVLKFMREFPIAMPPLLVYRNLRLREKITFSEDSVHRYLNQLADQGYLQRVKKSSLEDAKLEAAGDDDRAWYIITDEGINHLEN